MKIDRNLPNIVSLLNNNVANSLDVVGNWLSNGKINKFFWISFISTIAITCVCMPSVSWRPEIWAETGVLYLNGALHNSFFTNLFLPDYGYLPMFNRLVAGIIMKTIGLNAYTALGFQMCSVLFIALSCSLINLHVFRVAIANDWIRFLLGVSLGFGRFMGYEEYTFINVPYFGVIIWVLMPALMVSRQKFSQWEYWFVSVFFLMLTLSKPYFIVFLPVLLLLLGYLLWKKLYTSSAICCIAILGLMLQLYIASGNQSGKAASLSAKVFANTILGFLYAHMQVLGIGENKVTLAYVLIPALLLVAMLILWLQKKYVGLMMFVACNYVAVASLLLTWKAYGIHPGFNLTFAMPFQRHWYFTAVALLVGWLIFLAAVTTKKHLPIVLVITGFLVAGIALPKEFFSPRESYSCWKSYYPLLNKAAFYVPINPYPWAMSQRAFEICPEQRITVNQPYELKKTFFNAKAGTLMAIIVNREGQHINRTALPTLEFYNERGVKIENAVRILSPPRSKYAYFLVEKPEIPTAIKYIPSREQKAPASQVTVRFWGKVL